MQCCLFVFFRCLILDTKLNPVNPKRFNPKPPITLIETLSGTLKEALKATPSNASQQTGKRTLKEALKATPSKLLKAKRKT